MHRLITAFVLLTLFSCTSASPPLREEGLTYEILKKAGRSRIVALAAERVWRSHPDFRQSLFDRVSVLDCPGRRSVRVIFDMSVRVIPAKGEYYTGAEVTLPGMNLVVMIDTMADRGGPSRGGLFLKRDERAGNVHSFVRKSLRASRSSIYRHLFDSDGVTIDIVEREDVFYVQARNDDGIVTCSVDKKSGEVIPGVMGESSRERKSDECRGF